jgi:L-amino acid N-acyltransferase YncA
MDIAIREARPDDAEAVVGILNPVIETGKYTVLDGPFSVEEERRFRAFRRGIFHVAGKPAKRRVVGLQTMEPFAAYTRAFDHVGIIATCVDLACRRQGIGKQLFEATFEAARQKGYEKIFTYVRSDNPAALMAYMKCGFRIVGTAQKHAKCGGRYVDEIIIESFCGGASCPGIPPAARGKTGRIG